MGSFARTALSGESGLREAATHPWHAQGLADAFAESRADLTADERARYDHDEERA